MPSTPTTSASNGKLAGSGAQGQGQSGGSSGNAAPGLAARMGSVTKRLSGFGGSRFGSLRGANGDGGELGGKERERGAGGGKGNRRKGSSRGLNRMGSLAEDG